MTLPEQSDSQALLDFLLARRLHGDASWVGASSDAMVNQAVTGEEHPARFPMDQYDLDRCEETYRRAPVFLQVRMLPTLELFRRAVADGGLWCYGCDHGRHNATWSGFCKQHAEEAGIDTRPIWERHPERFPMPGRSR